MKKKKKKKKKKKSGLGADLKNNSSRTFSMSQRHKATLSNIYRKSCTRSLHRGRVCLILCTVKGIDAGSLAALSVTVSIGQHVHHRSRISKLNKQEYPAADKMADKGAAIYPIHTGNPYRKSIPEVNFLRVYDTGSPYVAYIPESCVYCLHSSLCLLRCLLPRRIVHTQTNFRYGLLVWIGYMAVPMSAIMSAAGSLLK
ncbi:hypothetical protein ABVT39_003553 [Epinephelus coioides]